MVKKYFPGKDHWSDFLSNFLIALVFVYVILFGIEIILPGLVTGVFATNYVLFLSFAVLFSLLVFFPRKQESSAGSKEKITFFFFFCLLGFLFVVLFFALYKVSVLETFGYLVLVIFSFRGILQLME